MRMPNTLPIGTTDGFGYTASWEKSFWGRPRNLSSITDQVVRGTTRLETWSRLRGRSMQSITLQESTTVGLSPSGQRNADAKHRYGCSATLAGKVFQPLQRSVVSGRSRCEDESCQNSIGSVSERPID